MASLAAVVSPASAKVPYDSLQIESAEDYAAVSKWDDRSLTFGFANGTPDIPADGEKQAVRDAFALWGQSTPLTFEEVEAAKAQLVVSWGAGEHGDDFPFDGQGGVLAHAYFPHAAAPLNGDAHFDEDETWTTGTRPNSSQPVDLVTVAAHEIGHSIGLGHSENPSALMHRFYTGSHRYLAQDDIDGALSLYGAQYGPEKQQIIGFQANTAVLWFHSSALAGGWNTGIAMAPNTSPSVAYVPGDGYVIAYQGTNNKLWIYRAADGVNLNTGLGMAAGTSPSMAVGGSGNYVAAFHATNGELWYYSSKDQWGYETKSGMAPGTSPSAGFAGASGYVVAFQSWQNELVMYSIASKSWTGTKLGMKAGTSPSLGAMPSGGTYAVAFQDWNHKLWLYSSQTGMAGNTTLGMEPKSSPSIAVGPNGAFVAAFQASNNELWYYSSAGAWGFSAKAGMAAGTSPSAYWIPSIGDFRIAFQDWQNGLYTYTVSGGGSWTKHSLGMKAGTSPSLTAY